MLSAEMKSNGEQAADPARRAAENVNLDDPQSARKGHVQHRGGKHSLQLHHLRERHCAPNRACLHGDTRLQMWSCREKFCVGFAACVDCGVLVLHPISLRHQVQRLEEDGGFVYWETRRTDGHKSNMSCASSFRREVGKRNVQTWSDRHSIWYLWCASWMTTPIRIGNTLETSNSLLRDTAVKLQPIIKACTACASEQKPRRETQHLIHSQRQ